MLHQYVQSQCPGSSGGTHAFKHVCLDLCQGLVGGEQNLPSPLFLYGLLFISPCQIGQAEGSVIP